MTLDIDAPGRDDVVVSFDPDGEGRASGILRLQTNDPDEPWVDVQLTGNATTDDVGEYTDPNDCSGDECYGNGGSGCGCTVAGAGGASIVSLLAGFLIFLVLRRRR